MPAFLSNPVLSRWLLLTQIGTTLPLFGLIWFVQIVHYPLFRRVGEPGFLAYEAEHANRTGFVVAPLMTAELLSALLLLLPRFRLLIVPQAAAWLGAALVILIWGSTALVQIPLHNRLHQHYDPVSIDRLVRSNWLRTIAWTLRAGLVLHWANCLFPLS